MVKKFSKKGSNGHQEDLGAILLASQARKLSLLREHASTWPCPENFSTIPSPEVMLPTKLPSRPRLVLVDALKSILQRHIPGHHMAIVNGDVFARLHIEPKERTKAVDRQLATAAGLNDKKPPVPPNSALPRPRPWLRAVTCAPEVAAT